MKYNIDPEKYTRDEADMLEELLARLNFHYARSEESGWSDGNFCGMATAMNMMGYKTRYDAEQRLWVMA